ncbi:MAG: BON domain-containing protein [Deltaproteobacteria bacterium]|nr:BON domain-containing protein [Deltaproteobacteria bacterium]
MGSHNGNGRGMNGGYDDYRPSWRPQDQRSDEDRFRAEGEDRWAQGQSGYAAGRHGGDRALVEHQRNMNQMQRPGRFEEHERGVGIDDRFSGGRGGDEHWTDRRERDVRVQPQRGLHRGKGPMNYTRSDEKIREQICEALTDDEHIDASNIDITVTGGEVTLTGTVEDRRAKRLAEDVADRCTGVKDIHNQLKVSDPQSRGQNVSVGKTDKGRA